MNRKPRFNILQNIAIFEKNVTIIDKSKIEAKQLLKKQNLPKQFKPVKELKEILLIENCDNYQSSNYQNKEINCQQPRRAKSLIEAIEIDFEDVDNPLTELELDENETQNGPIEMKPQKIYRTYSHKIRKGKELQQVQINNQDQHQLDSTTDSENDDDEDGPHLDSFTTDGEVLVNPTQEIDISTNSNIKENLTQLSQFYAVETQDEDPVSKSNSQDYRTSANIKLIDESMSDLFDDDERYMSCRSFESENDPIEPVKSVEPIGPSLISSQYKEISNTITNLKVPEETQKNQILPVQKKEPNFLEELNVPYEMQVFPKASGHLMKSVVEIPENYSLEFPTFRKASGQKIELKPEFLKYGQNILKEIMETPENIEDESAKSNPTFKKSIQMTESIEIKQNMFKDLIDSDDDELQQLNLDISIEHSMLPQASGQKGEVPQKFVQFGENVMETPKNLSTFPTFQKASGQKIEIKPEFQKFGENFVKSIFDTPIEETSKQTKPTSSSTPVSTHKLLHQKPEQKTVEDEFKVDQLLDSETLKEFDSSWDNLDFGSIDITGISKTESTKENLSNKRVASPSLSLLNKNPSKYLKLSSRINEVDNSPANDYVSFHQSISNRTSTPKPMNRCLGTLRRTSSKIMLSPSLRPTRLSDKFKH